MYPDRETTEFRGAVCRRRIKCKVFAMKFPSLISKYANYLADRCFRIDETGKTHFSPVGLLTRPLVVPSDQIKNRLRTKMAKFQLFSLVVVCTVVTLLASAYDRSAMFSVILLLPLASFLSARCYFAREYRELSPAKRRLGVSQVIQDLAEHHTSTGLKRGMLLCGAFVFLSFPMMWNPSTRITGILCISIFLVCGAGWTRALSIRTSSDRAAT